MDSALRRLRGERGQLIVIFALSLPVLLLLAGLVIDGGYAFAQRRSAQNTADFAALAGARVIAEFVSGDSATGTDANVRLSIDQTVSANNGAAVTYGAPDGPRYVDISGNLLGYVGAGAISPSAAGVQVGTSTSWRPFFLGLIGVDNWTASATATARGGYRVGGPPAGNLLPIGVSKATYDAAAAGGQLCPAGTPSADCTVLEMTPGTLNAPGQFGWLSFGCGDTIDGNGNPYGLGQNSSGCATNKPFLEGEWGNPPSTPPQSYGCCSQVGLPGSGDDIGGLPGNKAAVDDSTPGVAYYEVNELIGFVPIWDAAYGNGNPKNMYYHIIGYAGFQITHVDGAKNIYGILRQVIMPGPVGTVAPGYAGAPLAIELVQ